MTAIAVAKVLAVAGFILVCAWLCGRFLMRRGAGRPSQFVRLTAERRATFSESSEKSDIGGTAPPGATAMRVPFNKRNGRPTEDRDR